MQSLDLIVTETPEGLAKRAAHIAVTVLNQAIKVHGNATWVVAGGTAPMAAYAVLAKEYLTAVDWQKVYIVLGDERCVPESHPDANWTQIADTLFTQLPIPPAHLIQPKYDAVPERMAEAYAGQLMTLPSTKEGLPRLDLVWLGLGEDGHTLSLFPGHIALQETNRLVIAVHDAPKPPPERITLTLPVLAATGQCCILASGTSKQHAVTLALAGDVHLPITQAIAAIEDGGGHITWIVDEAAVKDRDV